MLENKIRALRQSKDILLMTHLVLGYPSFEANRRLVTAMVAAGVEIIEMQIPFSEPMADGPVILRASQESLAHGTTVAACLAFAKEMTALYPDRLFVFMTYANIVLAGEAASFVKRVKQTGVSGLIVPDLPPEEGADYLAACEAEAVDPIFIFTPTAKANRLKQLAGFSRGMVYCVARKGVTGAKTEIDQEMTAVIDAYHAATDLPLALGFGIQEKADIDKLKGHADIAVLGTKIVTLNDAGGPEAVQAFLTGLRA